MALLYIRVSTFKSKVMYFTLQLILKTTWKIH